MLERNFSDYSIKFDQYQAHFHILYVHGAWDGVAQVLEVIDDFKTCFDSTYTVANHYHSETITPMMTHTSTIT